MANKKAGVIPVNAGELAGGLKKVFLGMAEVFDSIGVGDEFISTADKVHDEVEDQSGAGGSKADMAAGTHTEPAAEKPKEPEKKAEAQPAPASEQKKPSITMQEIIGIVTKKIESDRKNSAKIGEIVKSFGISKLTELPENQYEAFLTQLTAL